MEGRTVLESFQQPMPTELVELVAPYFTLSLWDMWENRSHHWTSSADEFGSANLSLVIDPIIFAVLKRFSVPSQFIFSPELTSSVAASAPSATSSSPHLWLSLLMSISVWDGSGPGPLAATFENSPVGGLVVRRIMRFHMLLICCFHCRAIRPSVGFHCSLPFHWLKLWSLRQQKVLWKACCLTLFSWTCGCCCWHFRLISTVACVYDFPLLYHQCYVPA